MSEQQIEIEATLQEIVLGTLTLPAALYRVWSQGRNEGWRDAERMKVAERAAASLKAKPRKRRSARGKESTR